MPSLTPGLMEGAIPGPEQPSGASDLAISVHDGRNPHQAGLRFLDLFSGIGGFALGLERAGHHTAAFCEISPKCRHLLSHHWPEVPIYDDVQTLTADRLAADGVAVDAICGGFPCQDISLAGAGAGLAGARSGLWSEFARLVREIGPRVVIVENVSALLGRGLGTVLGDLAASGYDAEWDCIPASAVGAPHRRDRLWIVAYARGQQHEGYGDAFRRALASELFGAAVADADSQPAQPDGGADQLGSQAGGDQEARAQRQRLRNAADDGSQDVADARRWPRGEHDHWRSEPDVGRVAHGVPARVDRLHGLGNAVVPEIPYRLGRAISLAHTPEPIGKLARSDAPDGQSGPGPTPFPLHNHLSQGAL